VNYRGSSGFGRDFRLSLAGQWGILDVEDMELAARHLVNSEKASRRSVVMQGRSSGGYTALMALVLSGYFTAGVS
jgi:dipeptidyl aminopeptidase/acylaminoacyl peptidase